MVLFYALMYALLALLVVAALGEMYWAVYKATDGFRHRPRIERYRCDGQRWGVCDGQEPHSRDCPQWIPGEHSIMDSRPNH